MIKNLPIAVFDSGVGGLTVLKALHQLLPYESYIYLGDTARLPYGTKSQTTITKYTQLASNFLIKQGIKMLVIACNTASTLALPTLMETVTDIPIIGTLKAGAEKACEISKNNCIAVIATEATINSQGYQQAILNIRPNAEILTQSCGLFVTLAEEGWIDDPITEAIGRRYLEPLLYGNEHEPDCLLLGCTHFPILSKTINRIAGNKITLIDSAETTALAVKNLLDQRGLLNHEIPHDTDLQSIHYENQDNVLINGNRLTYALNHTHFMVTDSPIRFAKIAKIFLQNHINEQKIQLIETTLD